MLTEEMRRAIEIRVESQNVNGFVKLVDGLSVQGFKVADAAELISSVPRFKGSGALDNTTVTQSFYRCVGILANRALRGGNVEYAKVVFASLSQIEFPTQTLAQYGARAGAFLLRHASDEPHTVRMVAESNPPFLARGDRTELRRIIECAQELLR